MDLPKVFNKMPAQINFYSPIKEISLNSPQSVAIQAPDRAPLNYSNLVRQIQYCANSFKSMDLNHESRIGIVLPNGPEMASCCLGVMCSAVCAPLNPNYQADEFQFYLDDINADAIILPEGFETPAREVADKLGIKIIELITEEQKPAGSFRFANSEDFNISQDVHPEAENTALILHTSGTTSRPKIVPLTHKNLAVSAFNIKDTLQLTNADCALNMMPLFHIHGLVATLLSTLISGGRIVCTPGFQADSFPTWLEKFKPSWYSAVPTIHQAILALYESSSLQSYEFRFIRSSSSALPPATLTALRNLFNSPVIEAYGMTEAAHQMASNPLPPASVKPGSVGLSAGPEVAIMDKAGNILATGQKGEIVIKGENVTPGYENNPEANSSAFTKDWFRTGDQGYLDNDNYLFISGRLKEIINRGGEKISPREIDEALLEHDDVSQAVAFSVPHVSLGEDIFAAVVLKQNKTTTTEDLRAFLFKHLADYKVPSKIVLLDNIPKGATGKIQRLNLAKMLQDLLSSDYEAASSDNERLVLSVYEEVLSMDKIGIRDNFFASGGDSLKATQVISRINEQLEIDLPIPMLFKHPTPSELAHEIEIEINKKEQMMQSLIEEIDNMSDEEVERLLGNDD